MYRAAVLAFSVLPILSLSGCAQPQASSSAQVAERTAPLEFNAVVFTDYDLSRSWGKDAGREGQVYRLSVENHGQRPTTTGTHEVFVVLRNHTDYDYQIEARTHFFDDIGVPVDSRATWQRLTVPANSIAAYKTLSTTTQALQYRVEVRALK
jgi:uncharacterized protein YcfL